MKTLTDNQNEVFRFIRYRINKYPIVPSIVEMAEHFGVSTGSIQSALNALIKKGYIKRIPGKARAIEVIK